MHENTKAIQHNLKASSWYRKAKADNARNNILATLQKILNKKKKINKHHTSK